MAKKDYYETLGVPRTATKDEIKRAYHKMAHQHHPDKKGGNEAKFKEANEAYQILGDEQKRAKYDQFGTGYNDNAGGSSSGSGFSGGQGFGGFDFNGFEGFGGFEDIFEAFGGGGRSRSRRGRGQDIKIDLEISFEDSVSGKEVEINYKKLSLCDTCGGQGGFDPESCARCNGTGQVKQTFNSILGTMSQVVACPKCHGQGKSFRKVCSSCHGQGRARKTNSFKMKIPKGILDGEMVKFAGEGEAGADGAQAGDLFVEMHFGAHKYFKNEGVNIFYDLIVDMAQAALGDKVEIPTLYGNVNLKIESGTQPGDTIRISGKGLPKRGSWGGHGDMFVKVKVLVPKHLTSKQRELLEEFKAHKI